jgi:CRP-like cAMP-binding protein
MNVKYSADEIQEFLNISEDEKSKTDSQVMQKLLSVQDKITIFKNIAPNELKAIVYDLKFMRFKRKDYIVDQDSQDDEIYYMIDGLCQVFKAKVKIGELHPGSSFGESGAIFSQKRNATVICASESATLLSFKIDQENLDFSAKALAILYKNLASEINAKLDELNKQVSTKKAQ